MESKDLLSNLGLDVDMTSEAMESDDFINNRLREIGKHILGKQIAAGQEYVGSFAFHIVMDKNRLAKDKYSIATVTQIAVDDISESLVTLAFNNGMIACRRYFNPEFKSSRRGDKR